MTERPIPFTVRESARARRVRLRVTPREGLEVVVPRGYRGPEPSQLVEAQREWVERALARTEAQRERLREWDPSTLPEYIDLFGKSERRAIRYRPTAAERVTVTEGPAGELRVSGAVHDAGAVHRALRRWTMRMAADRLGARLEERARSMGARPGRLTVRWQRSRWGSCSSRGSISLNAKLVFLPLALLDHVIVHELSHLERADHSAAFYAVLERHDPAWREHRRQLRLAWTHVPLWAEG